MKKTILYFIVFFLVASIYVDALEGHFGPVVIKGQHVIENNESLKTGRHTFVLTAKNDAPMPEGEKESKEVTISSEEEFDFGEIFYEKPGIYEYSVTRITKNSNELKQDNSEYNVIVTIFNNSEPVIVFEKIGTEGKPSKIQYVDTYIKPKEKIKTGDNKYVLLYVTIFIMAIFMLKKSKK